MARRNKNNEINGIAFEIDFTYDQYLAMPLADRQEIYYALFTWFNNQGLALGIPRRQAYDFTMAKTIREEAFEFSAILRDFEQYFGEEF